MYAVTLICLLSVGFANLSSAGLCDSLNATPAEDVFGQQSNLKASGQQTKKSKRALLVCTSTEACLTLENIPFCINTQTGNFHNADLTTGNAITGDYVLADGRKGNLYHGPFPTPEQSSMTPEATITKGGIFGIATAQQEATDAPTVAISFLTQPTNAPAKSMSDGSGATTGGSGVKTDAAAVPGGAGRAELRLGMGMWIVVMIFSASIAGALVL